jgi:hypothetical protein
VSKPNITPIPAGAPWEKTGNTSWTQCPSCRNWFPAGPSLLERPEVKLHCPQCGSDFTQDQAARIIRAG